MELGMLHGTLITGTIVLVGLVALWVCRWFVQDED